MDIGDIKYLDQPAKVLKLSEAIRIGSKIRPQSFGQYNAHGKSCALGAAYEALTGKTDMVTSDQLIPLGVRFARAQNEYFLAYGCSIQEDNDSGMTREQIADRFAAIGF